MVLRIVLTILNVLAALGFFFMAGIDWAKRQEWADMVVQYDVRIDGIPLNEQDLDLEGNPRTLNIRPAVLQQVFQASGGQPVKTQEEEVKRVQSLIQAKVDETDPKETRAQKLARVLLTLAQTSDDRAHIKELAAANKADELQTELNNSFTRATNGGTLDATAPEVKSLDARRRSIAHFLFRMSELLQAEEAPAGSNPDVLATKSYERYVAVVGLVSASRELDRHALALQRLSVNVRDGMARDREFYLVQQRAVLAQIEEMADRVERQEAYRRVQADLASRHKALVELRRAEVDKAEKTLAAAQTVTAEQLSVQAGMEAELYKARREERDAFEKNQQMEQQIRALEKGR